MDGIKVERGFDRRANYEVRALVVALKLEFITRKNRRVGCRVLRGEQGYDEVA